MLCLVYVAKNCRIFSFVCRVGVECGILSEANLDGLVNLSRLIKDFMYFVRGVLEQPVIYRRFTTQNFFFSTSYLSDNRAWEKYNKQTNKLGTILNTNISNQ